MRAVLIRSEVGPRRRSRGFRRGGCRASAAGDRSGPWHLGSGHFVTGTGGFLEGSPPGPRLSAPLSFSAGAALRGAGVDGQAASQTLRVDRHTAGDPGLLVEIERTDGLSVKLQLPFQRRFLGHWVHPMGMGRRHSGRGSPAGSETPISEENAVILPKGTVQRSSKTVLAESSWVETGRLPVP